jgi:hypothetical protein
LNLPKGSIALHYYNWDTLGRNTENLNACENENELTIMGQKAFCGFDSHYPEYFPAVKGT